jgi:hypothetical protein
MSKLFEVKAEVKCLGEKQISCYPLPAFIVEAEDEFTAREKAKRIVCRWSSAEIKSVAAYHPNRPDDHANEENAR